LREENEAVVVAFLAAHSDFTLVPAGGVLARHGIVVAGDMLRLLPHRHHTDGFFAAVLERRS
jgi:16S rRNA (cytosine967-C5)-methyltransferase